MHVIYNINKKKIKKKKINSVSVCFNWFLGKMFHKTLLNFGFFGLEPFIWIYCDLKYSSGQLKK